jgi:hypothetical protein
MKAAEVKRVNQMCLSSIAALPMAGTAEVWIKIALGEKPVGLPIWSLGRNARAGRFTNSIALC